MTAHPSGVGSGVGRSSRPASPYILDLSVRRTQRKRQPARRELAAPLVSGAERTTRSDSAFVRHDAPAVSSEAVSAAGAVLPPFTLPEAGVRDVPYVFPLPEAPAVAGRRTSAVATPVQSLAMITRSAGITLPRGRIFGGSAGGLGWINGAFCAAGCLLVAFLIHDLQAWPESFQRLQLVRNRAYTALEQLSTAQGAVAAADLPAGEESFRDAAGQLAQAQGELTAALTGTQRLLAMADVTGTVRDGERLLKAGELLAEAGQQVTAGLEALFSSSVVAEAGEAAGPSLTEGITTAGVAFAAALEQLEAAQKLLAAVNSPLLPAAVREQAAEAAAATSGGSDALRAYLAQSDALLTLLGAHQRRHYLLVFQNSHELRPTGGFIGSIGLVDIDQGVLENIAVQSVYDPDGQLKEFIAPPHPLSIITTRWYLRDANWFVDFPASARKLISFFEKEGGPTPDGVIALTPHVVRDLVALTGPIEMPQYGVTVTAENFWEVTQDQVTYSYDREQNKPKQFMADLTPVLLNRVLHEPQARAGTLAALLTAASEKRLLLYFRDDALQTRITRAGWGGVFPGDASHLLAVNTANIAGHKSDRFVSQELDWDVRVQEDGAADVRLTISRTHHGPTEGREWAVPAEENPATKDNVVYQRVFPPAGAELKVVEGVTAPGDVPRLVPPVSEVPVVPDPDVVEWQRRQRIAGSGVVAGREAGADYFAHWLITPPGQTRVVVYQFRVPAAALLPTFFDPASRFEALLVKQPGDERTAARVSLRFPRTVRVVRSVPEAGITPVNSHEIIYRSELRRDTVVGAVLERP